MSLTQDIANMVTAANNLTSEVAGKMGQIQKAHDDAVDDFNNQVAGLRGEFPFINLLRNARATDKDEEGNYLMPISVGGAETAEIIPWLDVPQDVQADVPNSVALQYKVGAPCNAIHVVYGDAPSQYFLLNNAMSGRTTAGVGHLYVVRGEFFGLGPGKYNYQIFARRFHEWNIDYLSNPDANTEVWLFQPFLVAGWMYSNAERMLTLTNRSTGAFGL